MKTDTGILNFAAYNGSGDREWYGIADVVLPQLQHMTETIRGAGISGEIEEIFQGHIQAMSTTINFRTVTDAHLKMSAPRSHSLELRAVQQTFNTATGEYVPEGVKYLMEVTPKMTDLGKLAPASSGDTSLEMSVRYFAMFRDGKRELEVDPVNFIFYVDGKDHLENVRRALGK